MIDIIVPTYNRPNDIKKFVLEIQKQSFLDYKVIIIDDCSVSNIKELIPTDDIRFKYHRFSENKGQSFARNYAVDISTSPYLFFMDDDAYFLNENALLDFVNQVKHDDSDGWMFDVIEPNKNPLAERIKSRSGSPIGEFIACACAFKRSSFVEIGGFLSFFHSYGEETEMVMRMISLKKKMVFCPEIKVFHNYIPSERNKSWRERFLKNSMRNDIYIILMHYPLLLIPIYVFGKFTSKVIYEFKNSSNILPSILFICKGFLIGMFNSFEIIKKRKALSLSEFIYWRKIRW